MSPRTLRLLTLGAATALLPILLGARPLTERNRVGGEFTVTYTQQHALPVQDADGHALLTMESKGTNRSTGPISFMDGAETTNTEFADLTQGNGPQQGYATFSAGGEVQVAKWSGKVTTVLNADHQPVTTFEGTWLAVRGQKGSGSYKGRMTGSNSYVVDWQGELDPKDLVEAR